LNQARRAIHRRLQYTTEPETSVGHEKKTALQPLSISPFWWILRVSVNH
jgi:hypothetical protein